MKVKLPIYIKVALFILITLIGANLVIFIFSYKHKKTEIIDKTITSGMLNFRQISLSLVNPLWSVDPENVSKILESQMVDRMILSIKVWGVDSRTQIGGMIAGFVRAGDGSIQPYKKSFDSYINSASLKEVDSYINHKGECIGRVEMTFSKDVVDRQVRKYFFESMRDMSILAVVVLILLFAGMRKLILDPIVALNSIVNEYSMRRFNIRSRIDSGDEIGDLSKSFNYMANMLDDHNEKLLRQLYYDKLTGLPNRTKLILDFDKVECGYLLLVNLDAFQEINDFYGEEVGDSVLVEVASRLQNVNENFIRSIYRLQADEFGIIINDSCCDAADVAERIRVIVEKTVFEPINDQVFQYNESEISIRATVGVSKIGSDYNTTRIRILYNADMALKKAKQLQKHYLVYDEDLQITKEYENNIKWTFIIKEAITDDRIIPYFQPIVNNVTDKIEKYECLCRIIHRNGDIVSPAFFLDISKKARLYSYITKKILSKSFEMFEDRDCGFSINVSVIDIMNDDTRKYIKGIVQDNISTAKRAVFEILESEGINNYPIIKDFIEDMKCYGCQIAIDDFGSGYSNFDHIISLDIDYLKIDASMIKNIDKEMESQIITRTIVNFSKELNIKTVSEFVHSNAVLQKVKELGVDYSQGYFVGEPMSPAKLIYSSVRYS